MCVCCNRRLWIWARDEGTVTQPDYLVNRADQKKWGAIWGKKLHNNREMLFHWIVGVVGAWGHLTQDAILRIPRTKYKRSKNVFSVTSIALSCVHIWARLLQPLAQSLIGSPGTLLVNGLILLTICSKLQIIVQNLVVQKPQTIMREILADLIINILSLTWWQWNQLTTTANRVGGAQARSWSRRAQRRARTACSWRRSRPRRRRCTGTWRVITYSVSTPTLETIGRR